VEAMRSKNVGRFTQLQMHICVGIARVCLRMQAGNVSVSFTLPAFQICLQEASFAQRADCCAFAASTASWASDWAEAWSWADRCLDVGAGTHNGNFAYYTRGYAQLQLVEAGKKEKAGVKQARHEKLVLARDDFLLFIEKAPSDAHKVACAWYQLAMSDLLLTPSPAGSCTCADLLKNAVAADQERVRIWGDASNCGAKMFFFRMQSLLGRIVPHEKQIVAIIATAPLTENMTKEAGVF